MWKCWGNYTEEVKIILEIIVISVGVGIVGGAAGYLVRKNTTVEAQWLDVFIFFIRWTFNAKNNIFPITASWDTGYNSSYENLLTVHLVLIYDKVLKSKIRVYPHDESKKSFIRAIVLSLWLDILGTYFINFNSRYNNRLFWACCSASVQFDLVEEFSKAVYYSIS